MSEKLKGKVAVITGGSSGIGLATAKKFVEEGAYVFITGRRQSELDKAVKIIGKNVTAVQGDISKMADLDRLYAQVKAEKGSIDIIVASAGYVEIKYTPEVTPEHFDKTFDINAKGTFFTVQKAMPLLNNNGAIVLPIVDGQFKTKEEADGARAMFAQFTPLGRIGQPEEMAAATLFLACGDSSYITGVDLVADGGMTQL